MRELVSDVVTLAGVAVLGALVWADGYRAGSRAGHVVGTAEGFTAATSARLSADQRRGGGITPPGTPNPAERL